LDDDELLAETLLDCWQERLDQLDQFPLQAKKDEASQLYGKLQRDHRQGNALLFELRWFPTARPALTELKKASSCIGNQIHSLKQTATPTLPLAVYVDGHLKNDSGELRHGVAFIRQVRAWCEEQSAFCGEQKMARGLEDTPLEDNPLTYRPLLIAFSSDPDSNQAMLDAGADLAFEKQQYRQALEAALRASSVEEAHGFATR
jgi:hypothetical protein